MSPPLPPLPPLPIPPLTMKGWLQVPRLRIGEEAEEHRHATWLELCGELSVSKG